MQPNVGCRLLKPYQTLQLNAIKSQLTTFRLRGNTQRNEGHARKVALESWLKKMMRGSVMRPIQKIKVILISVDRQQCWCVIIGYDAFLQIATSSREHCMEVCLTTADCKWITFDVVHSGCFLFTDCPTLDDSQPTYISSSVNCQGQTSEYLKPSKLL